MPVVRSTRNHDDSFHYLHTETIGGKRTTSRNFAEAKDKYPQRTLPGDRPLVGRSNRISDGTRGVPNSHPTPSRQRASPSHVETWLARRASNEDYTNRPKAILQDTPTDGRYARPTQPGHIDPTERYSDTGSSIFEAPVDLVPGLRSQEEFDEEVMIYYHAIEESLASQFLNLDDERWACTDQTMAEDIESSVTSSSSLSSVVAGDTMEWELEPTSLHLFDMKKFETTTSFDGDEKMTPWPWGDYKYKPTAPTRYLEPEEYTAEYQLAEIEKVMREELMEVMAQEAIRDGKKAIKRGQHREGKEKRMAKRESDQPATLAFNNQVVRGRTIYNP